MLTNADIAELTDLRRALHRMPELSGQEQATAARVTALVAGADTVLTGLGGHGVAAIFNGTVPGPTVMIRAELDALPITELSSAPWASAIPGKGHLCGHDGHTTLLLGLARLLSRRRPARGRVVLMFQPAEEDGSGAAAVIADPRFAQIAPDWAFAIHNLPGVPLGHAWLRPGPANCASMGLRITLSGKTAHAAQPEAGTSPAPAVARLLTALPALGQGGDLAPDYRLVTLTHARLGEPAFGIAPGAAEVWATLRTLSDAPMAVLLDQAQALGRQAAAEAGLQVAFTHHDVFAACTNDEGATDRLAAAAAAVGIPVTDGDLPMRASEDFGRFGAAGAKAAMLFLGAGTDHPHLHNPDYDFPDSLIAPGVRLFEAVVRDLLG